MENNFNEALGQELKNDDFCVMTKASIAEKYQMMLNNEKAVLIPRDIWIDFIFNLVELVPFCFNTYEIDGVEKLNTRYLTCSQNDKCRSFYDYTKYCTSCGTVDSVNDFCTSLNTWLGKMVIVDSLQIHKYRFSDWVRLGYVDSENNVIGQEDACHNSLALVKTILECSEEAANAIDIVHKRVWGLYACFIITLLTTKEWGVKLFSHSQQKGAVNYDFKSVLDYLNYRVNKKRVSKRKYRVVYRHIEE